MSMSAGGGLALLLKGGSSGCASWSHFMLAMDQTLCRNGNQILVSLARQDYTAHMTWFIPSCSRKAHRDVVQDFKFNDDDVVTEGSNGLDRGDDDADEPSLEGDDGRSAMDQRDMFSGDASSGFDLSAPC